jgi:WD40 repeat protein
MNAHVFSSSIGANGYIPQHKEPPRYIKVRAHNKKRREFNRMFLAQELSGSKHAENDEKTPGLTSAEFSDRQSQRASKPLKPSGAVWSMEFSKDGKYLAAGGRDQVVRVWAVISTPEEREAHEHEEDVSSATGGERLRAPVFRSEPVRRFEGHTGDILDLSWSKNNFLLSSSMDKTVRLWHISRQECLCTFKHKDFVTSIAFHPRDDRFFLAGSLDSVLRLWSIPDKTVAYWNQLPDLITAVAFSPDGKTAIAGVLSGLCLFYDTEGLKYHTQIHVRSSRGKNAKGSKITGIRTMTFPPDDPDGDVKVLVTSNDSRVRMYNLRDKSLELKFRGHENTCSQINASFSDDAKYVICGSEDRKAYIWSIGSAEAENKDRRALEFFEAHSDIVTATVMAPMKSRQLLSVSGDPLYDLCNPPPVTLLSREESNASSMPVPASESDKRRSDAISESQFRRPEESPAYLARCAHMDGNIIITADYQGCIKVFRQDCAYQKRRNILETGSMFSKKMLGRSSSIMTRNSTGGSRSRGNSVSRRNSVSRTSNHSNQGRPTDHILSWRDSVNNTAHHDDGFRNRAKTSRSDRSISPGRFSRISRPNTSSNSSSTTRNQQKPAPSPLTFATPTASTTSPSTNISQPPTPGFSIHSINDDNALRIDPTGKGYQFWNMSSMKAQVQSALDPSKSGTERLRPPLSKGNSYVSRLSSDDGTSGELGDGDESDGSSLTCTKCGGKDFRARRVAGKGQRLACTRCGTTTD